MHSSGEKKKRKAPLAQPAQWVWIQISMCQNQVALVAKIIFLDLTFLVFLPAGPLVGSEREGSGCLGLFHFQVMNLLQVAGFSLPRAHGSRWWCWPLEPASFLQPLFTESSACRPPHRNPVQKQSVSGWSALYKGSFLVSAELKCKLGPWDPRHSEPLPLCLPAFSTPLSALSDYSVSVATSPHFFSIWTILLFFLDNYLSNFI